MAEAGCHSGTGMADQMKVEKVVMKSLRGHVGSGTCILKVNNCFAPEHKDLMECRTTTGDVENFFAIFHGVGRKVSVFIKDREILLLTMGEGRAVRRNTDHPFNR